MAQVTLVVNGRRYTVACQDGQEEHLLGLSKYIDQKVEDLKSGAGQLSEAHLMLMAGLLLADELHEAYLQLDELKGGAEEAPSRDVSEAKGTTAEEDLEAEKVASALEACAERLENIAARLESH